MNIVIPIAALNNSEEFTDYTRNLYEIEHKIAFQHIYDRLCTIENANFIVIIKREDVVKFHFDDIVRLMIPNVKIIVAEGETCGSACTCLLAVDYIDNNEPLLIANCDQLITKDWQIIINSFTLNKWDGVIVIFDDIHPKWSFVKLDSNGLVIEAAEKRPISRNATTGHYYFKNGMYFVEYAKIMIRKGASVNGQYFCCPIYNEMILKQKKIGTFRINKTEIFSFKDKKGMNEYEYYLKENKSENL